MDALTAAVKILCKTPPKELVKAEGIEQLFSLLKRVYKASTTPAIPTKRFQELRDFCNTNGPDALVGERPDYDYRIIDIQFADSKNKPDDLRRSIRRVMGERSLAEDYIRVHPHRLRDACQSVNMRGKRKSQSITAYATENFPSADTAIVTQAITNGLKALAIEKMDIQPDIQPEEENMGPLPVETRAGFMGLVAIVHRGFCRTILESFVEELRSLPEALRLVSDISPLMLAAYEIYKRQAPNYQASKRQRLCGVRDSDSSSDPTSLARPKSRERLDNQASVISNANTVYLTTSNSSVQRQNALMPQGECQSGSTRRGVQEQGAGYSCRSTNADGAVVHNSSGDDVPRLPSDPYTVNQQELLSLRYNVCGNDTSSNNAWPTVGFLEFGGASASHFQVADVSQFGGTFSDVAQPIDISDFGNASTVIPPSASHFQVADVSQFGGTFSDVDQPIDISDFGNASTVIPPSSVWQVDGT